MTTPAGRSRLWDAKIAARLVQVANEVGLKTDSAGMLVTLFCGQGGTVYLRVKDAAIHISADGRRPRTQGVRRGFLGDDVAAALVKAFGIVVHEAADALAEADALKAALEVRS